MNRIATILRGNALAIVALFFAMSGTAVAAGGLITGDKIAPETVTATNIKDGTVAMGELANNAVTGYKVADSSLTGQDIYGGSIEGVDIADGTIGLARLAVKEGTWASIGGIDAGECKTVGAGGMPVGAPTFAVSTMGGVSASSAVVNGSGYTMVTLCNHTTNTVVPGFKVYAFLP